MIISEPFVLPIIVDNSAPITINAQIVEQIKLLIATGELHPGDALPTVTQLAKHLGVNHNTIAAVYNYLIESNYLIAQRGKGTFVADTLAVKNIVNHKQFYNLLSQAFSTATMMKLSPSEFAGAAYAQAVMLNQHTITPLKLVFVECLQHSVEIYEAIQAEIQQDIEFLSLEELKAQKRKALKELSVADLIVTTTQHLWDIIQIATPSKEVIGINIKPDLQLLTHISSLPRNSLVLLVCEEETESEDMKKMLQQSGISHINFQTLSWDYLKENRQLLKQASLICVSKKLDDDVRQYSHKSDKLIVFNFSFDETNMSVLKARIAAIMSAR
ncbi:MAG: GntR family transcriptional regulator [Richelia sp. SM2_1_7]|nr:GntR family transcriptional regulator [Richelia sp. SM2_1_7]